MEHSDDFARVVRAKDGAQVLVYKEPSDEDGGWSVVFMTSYGGILQNTRLGYSSEEAADDAIKKAVAEPDLVRDAAVSSVRELAGG